MPKPVTGVGRGGKPQPLEVKRARGTAKAPAPDTTTSLANIDPTEVPAAPEWCDEYGSAVWRLVWAAGRRHLSEQHDHLLITLLVQKLQERQAIRDWLGTEPARRWYTTANGQTVSHPAVKQLEQIDAQITGWLSMLGFSPSDRARLGLAEVRVANELDAFRRRKHEVSTDVRNTESVIDI